MHCDPHPGNILVEAGAPGKGVQIVLLDNGLYSVSNNDHNVLWITICFHLCQVYTLSPMS